MTFEELCAACAAVGEAATGRADVVSVVWGTEGRRSYGDDPKPGEKWFASFGSVRADADDPSKAVAYLADQLRRHIHDEVHRRRKDLKDAEARQSTADAVGTAIAAVYTQVTK